MGLGLIYDPSGKWAGRTRPVYHEIFHLPDTSATLYDTLRSLKKAFIEIRLLKVIIIVRILITAISIILIMVVT